MGLIQSAYENGKQWRPHHILGRNFPVSLDVPKAEGANRGRDGLCKTQIGVLQEAELELIVLADVDECPRSVQTLDTI